MKVGGTGFRGYVGIHRNDIRLYKDNGKENGNHCLGFRQAYDLNTLVLAFST